MVSRGKSNVTIGGVVKIDMNDKDLKKQINKVKEVTQQTGEAPNHDEDGNEDGGKAWAWDDITGRS